MEDSPGEGRLQKGHEVRASLVDLKDFRDTGTEKVRHMCFLGPGGFEPPKKLAQNEGLLGSDVNLFWFKSHRSRV